MNENFVDAAVHQAQHEVRHSWQNITYSRPVEELKARLDLEDLRMTLADTQDLVEALRATVKDLQAQLSLAEAQTKQAEVEAAYWEREAQNERAWRVKLQDTMSMMVAQHATPGSMAK